MRAGCDLFPGVQFFDDPCRITSGNGVGGHRIHNNCTGADNTVFTIEYRGSRVLDMEFLPVAVNQYALLVYGHNPAAAQAPLLLGLAGAS